MPPRPGSFKEPRRKRLQDVEDETSNIQEANLRTEQDEGDCQQGVLLDAAEQPVLMAVTTSGSQIGVSAIFHAIGIVYTPKGQLSLPQGMNLLVRLCLSRTSLQNLLNGDFCLSVSTGGSL